MSYVKLPTGVQDYAVGYQSINQANSNAVALKEVLEAKHALGNDGFATSSFTNPLNEVGRHNDNLIARSILQCYIDNTGLTPALLTRLSGPAVGAFNYIRRAAGQWQCFIQAPFTFFGVVAMPATSAIDYQARSYRVIDPTFGPSLIVSTWAIDTGVWALADLDFTLGIWMRR